MEMQAHPQSVDEAFDWYLAIDASVVGHRAMVIGAFQDGLPLSERFVGLDQSEIVAFFDRQRTEVAAMSIVGIVAAAEATIRADFGNRVQKRGKDRLSATYTAFYKSLPAHRKSRPPLDGILDRLQSSGAVEPERLVNEFRAFWQIRHWYAHGRYWLLRSTVETASAEASRGACAALIEALPP